MCERRVVGERRRGKGQQLQQRAHLGGFKLSVERPLAHGAVRQRG